MSGAATTSHILGVEPVGDLDSCAAFDLHTAVTVPVGVAVRHLGSVGHVQLGDRTVGTRDDGDRARLIGLKLESRVGRVERRPEVTV